MEFKTDAAKELVKEQLKDCKITGGANVSLYEIDVTGDKQVIIERAREKLYREMFKAMVPSLRLTTERQAILREMTITAEIVALNPDKFFEFLLDFETRIIQETQEKMFSVKRGGLLD